MKPVKDLNRVLYRNFLLEDSLLRVRRDAIGFKGSQLSRDLVRVVDERRFGGNQID